MEIMKIVVDITRSVIAANQADANLDPMGAVEVAEYMYSLKYAIEQMEQGMSREDILDKLMLQRKEGCKRQDK